MSPEPSEADHAVNEAISSEPLQAGSVGKADRSLTAACIGRWDAIVAQNTNLRI